MRREKLSKFCWEKRTADKKCIIVTFKWLWKLNLSGQSVMSLTEWVNCLGTSRLSFSLLLLSSWCARFNLRMPQLCTCRQAESCSLTGKEKKSASWFHSEQSSLQSRNPWRVSSPHFLPWLHLQLLQRLFFFFYYYFYFHVPSRFPVWQNDCREVAMRVRWCDNCCVCLLLHLFPSAGLTASIFSYVNVTLLPYGPHNIHLLVEMPQNQSHCASIHCWCCRKKGGGGGGGGKYPQSILGEVAQACVLDTKFRLAQTAGQRLVGRRLANELPALRMQFRKKKKSRSLFSVSVHTEEACHQAW